MQTGRLCRLQAKDELSTGFCGTVYLELLPDPTYPGRLTVHQAFMAVMRHQCPHLASPHCQIESVATQPDQAEVLRRPADRPLAPAEELGRCFDEPNPVWFSYHPNPG